MTSRLFLSDDETRWHQEYGQSAWNNYESSTEELWAVGAFSPEYWMEDLTLYERKNSINFSVSHILSEVIAIHLKLHDLTIILTMVGLLIKFHVYCLSNPGEKKNQNQYFLQVR